MKFLLALLFLISCAYGRELYPGQYANVPKEIREWFTAQLIPSGPKKGQSCCSTADGVEAEEDIRGENYWTRFNTPMGRTDWMQVPNEVVLTGPNKHGAPMVWYFLQSVVPNQDPKPEIRCYAPGSGI